MVETHLKNNYIDWIPVKENEKMLILTEQMDHPEGKWDYIVAADAFARAASYKTGKDPYGQFFEDIKPHLNTGGHLILAVDNRYGLWYFAGSREHLTGRYFEGLEGYPSVEGIRTFSKEAVLKMAKEHGFAFSKTYYPYPDHRCMTTLYTDGHLPAAGELRIPQKDFEEERLHLFDEGKVFDGLIREGWFPQFSNSYLFDLTLEPQDTEEELLFVKYSVERKESYRIRTEILKKADGTKIVRKVPYGEKAAAHVRALKTWEARLKEQYEPEDVLVNRCTLTEKGAEFEFLKGETLEALLDQDLERNDYAAFLNRIREYAEKLERLLKPEPFTACEKFREIFGETVFETPQSAAKLNNIDLIFSNILLAGGKWNVIDYEWTFDFQIPIKFIIYRSVKLYCEQRKEKSLQRNEICRMLSISEKEELLFDEMEHRLQLYLLGGTKTREALEKEYGGKSIDVKEILRRAHQPEMKVYEDRGQGFCEKDSYELEAEEDFYGRRRFTLHLSPEVVALRLDPCEQPCMVTVNRILGECSGSYELTLTHNGKAYEKAILYSTTDPQIILNNIVPGTGEIHLDLTVEYLKEETVYGWMKLLERAEKYDRIEKSKPYRWLKKIKKFSFHRSDRNG